MNQSPMARGGGAGGFHMKDSEITYVEYTILGRCKPTPNSFESI